MSAPALDTMGWTRPIKRSSLSKASLFAHGMCITCLCLQRFGLPFGTGQLFLSVVICPLLIVWLLMNGQARIRASTALLYCLMLCCLLASAIGGVLFPDPRMRFSFLSIGELLIIYAALMVEPSENFDSAVVLKVVAFYVRMIAILGILQYGLQFAHIRLFSFVQLVPALKKISTEAGYHVVAPIKYESATLRSNGFFLLEPSILSQVMAIGIVVDYFVLGRLTFLPVFALAAIVSYSGTGPLALILSLSIAGLLSPSQLYRTALFGVVAVVVAGVCAVVFPAEFATLANRASGSDPSSNLRYAAQFQTFNTILNDARVVVGFGPGAADGYVGGVAGSMSPALKLFFDYGLIGAIAFVVFLLKALWRPDKMILSITCLIIFQVGGGYLVFPPLIFLIALVCIWSKPVIPVIAPRRVRPGAPA